MAGSGGAGQVVNLIHRQKNGQGDVMADQFEIGPTQQVFHIGLLTGEEVVQTDDIVALGDQPFAQMGA
jgi:hypothetical protein